MFKGESFLLKMGDGESPEENFTTLGCMTATAFEMQRALVPSGNVASGQWRVMRAEQGKQQLRVRAEGIATSKAVSLALEAAAFGNDLKNFVLDFGDGREISGPFLLARYDRKANAEDIQQISLVLESAGTVILHGV